MNNMKILMVLGLILVVLVFGGFGLYIYAKNAPQIKSNTVDYIPKENLR